MNEQYGDEIPQAIKGWNWGAFMYNITWGFGNKTYLPLLCLIPVFNIVWIFVCGFKGNEWAWQKGNYEDVETFLAVQQTWNRAGIVSIILSIIAIIIFLFLLPVLVYVSTSYLYN